MSLIKEALYSFEVYLLTNYDFKNRALLTSSYDDFLLNSGHNFIPMAERADDHIKAVFYALQEEKDLWKTVNDKVVLNYESDVMRCLISEIQDEETKNLMTSLTGTSILQASSIAPVLRRQGEALVTDKALATYVALDLFYAKLVELDLSLSPEQLGQQIKAINNDRANEALYFD